MAKKNALISASADNGVLSFVVGNVGQIDLTIADLSEEIRNHALIHGLVQKVSDAAAMPKADLPTDETEAAKVKLEAMRSVANRLIEGDWSKRSGDGTGPVQGLIYRAFEEYVIDTAKKRKKDAPTTEAIRQKYDSMERKEQLALRNVPGVAKIIERIKSERGAKAASAVDTDSLLGELGL